MIIENSKNELHFIEYEFIVDDTLVLFVYSRKEIYVLSW